ncbi:MAG: hypothetical protein IPH53_02370 [Flavobacteriales bacterium]|nr:hypothetical protein [Flavobacteriales bacterium]
MNRISAQPNQVTTSSSNAVEFTRQTTHLPRPVRRYSIEVGACGTGNQPVLSGSIAVTG